MPGYNTKVPYSQMDDPPPSYQATVNPTVHTSSTTFVGGPVPSYGTTPIIVQPVTANNIILVGGCPACKVGVLDDSFTLGGLCCAFWFFPIGILCCLAMTEKKCSNCGASFA